MSFNREAAINRIRNLRAKTVENGCTEAEAASAAKIAGDLMDKYLLSMSDIEIKQEKCKTQRSTEKSHPVEYTATAISRYCGVKVWKRSGKIFYFGLDHDMELALYLTDLFRTSMDSSFKKYMARDDRPKNIHGRRLRQSFMVSMANRLADRLDNMTKERKDYFSNGTGTNLIVVKNAVVEKQFNEIGMRLGKNYNKGRGASNADASNAGRNAGNGVNITTGVGGSSRYAAIAG